MNPYVTYAGLEEEERGGWRMSFDLIRAPESPPTRYFIRVAPSGGLDDVDVDAPFFWPYMAYLGAKFVENEQILDHATGELFSPVDEAVERAAHAVRSGHPSAGVVIPKVGQVCWRFGSPPYPDALPSDHSWNPADHTPGHP